jgi:hypothetical protein
MVNPRWPAGSQHLRVTRKRVLVAAGVVALLAISSAAFAVWTASGWGTAVARTGFWTGAEIPDDPVKAPTEPVTLTSPADGSATREPRPTLRGTTDGAAPEVTVAIARKGATPQALPATVTDGAWSARPLKDLPEGVYTIRARRTDQRGRATWSSPSTFTVDTTAPVTVDDTAAIGDGWSRDDQTVTLRPADPEGSGVAATYLTTDNDPPTTASSQGASIRLGEGVHVLSYFSVDRAGNREAVRTAASPIRIDQTAPDSATLDQLPAVLRDGQMLSGRGDDALSGVAGVHYEYCTEADCASWTPIGSSTTAPGYALAWHDQPADGRYQVRTTVLDAAGNMTASATQRVRVDNTAPTVVAVTGADGNSTVEAGEELTVGMSEPLDLASLPSATSLTFSRQSSGGTTMDIPGLTDGPIDTGTAAWVAEGASVTYSGVLSLTDDGRVVRFNVQACESGCADATDGDTGELHFAPAGSLSDPAGNAATGTVLTTSTLF